MATTETVLEEKRTTFVLEPWNVILLNDDWHTFDEVIEQLMKATNCTAKSAAEIAWVVHTHGEALCFTGSKERCELVADILEEIKLGVRIEGA